MDRPIQRKDSYLSTFVKAEKINFSAKPDPAPRVIQPRNPRYNVELGVYLKPIEHELYKCIGEVFGGPVVVKGLNAQQRGRLISSKWSKFQHPVAIGLDAKRFDQHTSKQALRWEHSVYLNIYKNDPVLAKLLSWQINNRGFGRCQDGDIFYRTVGSRMSGDMNTALGNVLIMCGLMWTYMRTLGVKYEFVNDGDDCILMVEARDEHRLATLVPWFREMGYVMEREPSVSCLERVDFCQARPVFDGTEYRMVRVPKSTLSKDLVNIKLNMGSIHARKQWESACTAIGECGAALAGDMPVFWKFYQMLSRASEEGRKPDWGNDLPGMFFLSLGMDRKCSEPTPETRFSFWKAFDITPDEQVALESFYESAPIGWDGAERNAPVKLFTHIPCVQQLCGC
jgi:hypothetical protein